MNQIVQTSYPLSSGQEAMWFIQQIAPGSVAYNILIAAKINSYLYINVVNRVWEKIIENHPILRTTYTSHEGKAVQQINQQQKFKIEVIDSSNWSEDHLKEKIFAIADCPFNLEKDAVLRVNLFTLSAKEHILVLTMHHIAGDMWSFDLLLSEFRDLYTIEIAQVSQEHTETANDFLTKNKSYIDFIHWQSEMLSSSRGEKQWQYWQKQLAGELPILNLPTDKPRPPVQTYRGASYIKQLDEQLNQKIRNLALAYGTSPYQILLTAFYVLLYRYTNQQDILVGSPMRGRWGGDFTEIVGYCVNLTVLRVSVNENTRFNELLAQVNNTVTEAQNHQDYPFCLLAEKLEQKRDPSRPPLCQVSFTWQRQRWCEATENSLHSREQVLQMEPYLLGHQRGADFDLNLIGMEAQGLLQLCWQYNTDLFDLSTIERMTDHFVTLLEGIVANAEQQISQLPLLSEVEQHQLLVEWNDTGVEYPQDKCIHQLFEEQVERTPDAVAVEYENQQLTYRQLNSRANQLAHYLQTLGVKPDVLVGICVERSLEIVVGLLGILKAGGAYVPLDPEYPTERLSFMLEDAQIPILLTQQKLVDKFVEHNTHLICFDRDLPENLTLSIENPVSEVTPENLAYIIYTSGSTGKPKGTMIPHRGLVNYLSWCTKAYVIAQGYGAPVQSSIGFDATITSLFSPLLVGKRVVLLPEKEEIEALSALLQSDKNYSLVKITPAHLKMLNQMLPYHEGVTKTRALIIGGEALLGKSLKFWRDNAPNTRIINEYGPTETVVGCCVYEVDEQTSLSGAILIGRPIANTQLYLLDENQKLVPIGVPGELYIGGAGVARGYLNRPELTQQRFIPNPFSDEPNSRLYKTGDLARYLPDGNIEYLGRIDNQVKIRGFRIELGEIEAVLSQHSDVQTSCAIAREDSPGQKQLVAYVVPRLQMTLTISELRYFLKAKLPDYMIPQTFVMLESLPLTPNGKIDRRALPKPDLHSQPKDKFVAPRTPIEEMLAQIWEEVLKVEQVGIHDNFFELGGDSILSIQIITRARQAGLLLTPKQLFTHQTIAESATVAGTIREAQTEQGLGNCSALETDNYTLNDFPLLQINQLELEQILENL